MRWRKGLNCELLINENNKIKHTRGIAAYQALSSLIDNGAGTVVLFSLPLPPPLPCGASTRGIAAHQALSSAIDNGARTVVLFSLTLSLPLPRGAGANAGAS